MSPGLIADLIFLALVMVCILVYMTRGMLSKSHNNTPPHFYEKGAGRYYNFLDLEL